MARANSTGLTPQITRPVAAPVDVFSRTGEGQQLSQLAEGLSRFAPSLGRFAEVLDEQKSAKERIAGENKARELQTQGLTYAQAIRDGHIKPSESPWFRMGAYETFGRVAGNHYADELDTAFRNSDHAQGTDPKDFDTFEAGFRQEWTKKNLGDAVDPYMQNAFGKTAENRVLEQRAQFSRQAGEKLVQQAGEGFHAEVFQTLGRFRGGDVHAEELAQLLKVSQERQHAVGMSYEQINRLTASAIVSAAKRFNDVSLLDVMDEVKAGSGSLSGTSYGSSLREQAENEIAATNQALYSAQYVQKERHEKELVEQATANFVTALQQAPNPALFDPKPYMADILKYEPAKAETLYRMRDAYAKREYTSDPQVAARLLLGIHTSRPGEFGYTTQEHLDRALAGQQLSLTDYATFSAQITSRAKENDKVSKLFNDDGLKYLTDTVRSNFVAEYGDSKEEDRQRANQAVNEARDRYLRWRSGNEGATATPAAVNEWIGRESNRVFGTKAGDDKPDTFKAIPKAQYGTPLKDHPVTLPPYLMTLQSELTHLEGRTGNRISTPGIAILKKYGVSPDAKAIRKFVDEEIAKIPNYRPPRED